MIDLIELGKLIRAERKKQRLTKQMLANDAKVSLSTIRDLEVGKINITIGTLNKVLKVLNVKLYLNLEK